MRQFAPPVSGTKIFEVAALQQSETESFHNLYKALFSGFVREASIILNSPAEAPNIINHAFIKCWLRSKDLSTMSFVNAFLHVTIRNNCKAYNDSSGYRSIHHDNVLKQILSPSILKGGSVHEVYSRDRMLSQNQKDIIRDVFNLFYTKQLSIPEIIEESGMPAEWVQNTLDQALQTLHLIISDQIIDNGDSSEWSLIR